ncbi:MAG: hypothetical protein ACR2P0_10225 [Acidimicrobiales bacterium]
MSAALLLVIIGGGVAAAMAAAGGAFSRHKKTNRVEHTSHARGDTKTQLAAMSDLILDLEPRIVIANDGALAERFAAAGRTYIDILEHEEKATTGHEIADIRVEIARARWQLDVIDAELDRRPPPPEPFRRDTSGSAWDSTRGTGADGVP